MDSEKIELIKECLKRLITNGTLLLTFSLIALFAKIQKLVSINFAQFSINSDIAGWFILTASIMITLSLLKKYDSIISIYNQIEKEEYKNKIKFFLNSHPSILNPFAEQSGSLRSKFLDIWGYSIVSLTPLLSFLISISFIKIKPVYSIALITLFVIINILFTETLFAEKYALLLICPKSEKRKRYTSAIIAVVGITVYVLFLLKKI